MSSATRTDGTGRAFTALCRDCLATDRAVPAPTPRCAVCGSPRVVEHAELSHLAIAHVDCDAFFAAVEKRDDPALRDRPVIVGGGRRGVVSAACYIARISGVRSAMPMFKALKACPDAVVVKPDHAKYSAVSRQVRTLMRDLTPLVEPLSIDEAFLDLSGTERLHHRAPAATLAAFAARIEAELGITVSVGLSHNKFLAKIASDLDKPRGFAVIGRGETAAFLADKPVSLIWGVGRAMQASLESGGLRTIGDLRAADPNDLARRYGGMGLRLAQLARGEDARPVRPDRETKSISAETTFNEDIADGDSLTRELWRLAEKVARRLRAAGLAGRSITLKMKTADFRIRTRSRQLADPTRLVDRIHRTGRDMLLREIDGTRYRLIGIGVSDFSDIAAADPDDLVDTTGARIAKAEDAVDRLRARYGQDAVARGLGFTPKAR